MDHGLRRLSYVELCRLERQAYERGSTATAAAVGREIARRDGGAMPQPTVRVEARDARA